MKKKLLVKSELYAKTTVISSKRFFISLIFRVQFTKILFKWVFQRSARAIYRERWLKKKTKVKNVNSNETLFVLMISSTIKFTRNKWKEKIDKFRIVRHAKKEWKRKFIESTIESLCELKFRKETYNHDDEKRKTKQN